MTTTTPRDKTVVLQPGKSILGQTGGTITAIVPTPRCVVDSHMHVMNGACTPLPLLWDKQKIITGWRRKTIDALGKKAGNRIGIGDSGKLQVLCTEAIADRAVADNELTFAPGGTILSGDLYKTCDFFSPMIVMPMDMEYAHIAGYDGQPIYHTDESPWYYHKRLSGAEPEENGLKVPLPGETTKSFTHWKEQYKDTVSSVRKHPLKLIPMYHYEPRRWCRNTGTEIEKTKWVYGSWNFPFEEVATAARPGIFLGFKMYTPLGYQPLDSALPHLWQHSGNKTDCFYGKCEDEGIPILAHCSPGGMTTHEMLYYSELHRKYPYRFDYTPSVVQNETTHSGIGHGGQQASSSGENEIDYFYRCHVHLRRMA